MKTFIGISKIEGKASRQAHADLPSGTYEREMSKEGFFGPAAQFYHKRPPTNWINWDGPLRPRAFDLNKLQTRYNSPCDATEILFNLHCRVSMWRTYGSMDHLFRNADGDQLLFIHKGNGELFCDFGRLKIRSGDYIMLPRGTMWRSCFTGEADILMMEASNSSFKLPDKGLVGNHALFDPAMLDTPVIDDIFLKQQTAEDSEEFWNIKIKKRNEISIVTYPYNPLDVVGWHGDLMAVSINIGHFRPLSSHRYHLPPSAHTTFQSDRFVICTFCPRPFEKDSDTLKIPFFHNNDDYDEVLFYHRGNFLSRDNIDSGMLTFHPSGFTHGPHPKAQRNMFEAPSSKIDEYAIMIDTRDPLEVGKLPHGVENEDYVRSWGSTEK